MDDADVGDVEYAAELARHVAHATFESLPEEAVSTARLSLLDTLGVTLAATGLADGLGEIVAMMREGHGAPHSTIIGFGDRMAMWDAAFVNGAAVHALDFDD